MVGRPVSVRSAFGGIVVLLMKVPKRLQLQWHGDHGCEHWAFCMGAVGGAGIGCPEVTPLVIHVDKSIAWHPTYPDFRRQQLKAFWRDALM